ncbi:MAG: hypothetical protein ACRDJP_04240 [Actinomycetota bacterium]
MEPHPALPRIFTGNMFSTATVMPVRAEKSVSCRSTHRRYRDCHR